MSAKRYWKNAGSFACVALVSLVLGAPTSVAAQDGTNPYLAIVDRNTFGLKDPPPIAPPPPPEPPPAPPANTIKLTGITSLLSKIKALFEVTEPGNPVPRHPIMAVGDPAQYGVEVLAIDLAKNEVRIRNGSVETNITFGPASMSAPPPTVATLPGGRMNPRNFPGPGGGAAAPNPAATSTVIGNTRRSSPSGRNNIVVSGAEPTSMSAYASGGNIPAIPNTATSRSIPTTRPLRTPTQPNAPQMTREEAIIRLELQREVNHVMDPGAPPLPPTPITPSPTGYETDPQD